MGLGAWLWDLIAWWRGSRVEPPHPSWVRITGGLCLYLGLGFTVAAVMVGNPGSPSDSLLAVGIGLSIACVVVFLVGLFVGPGHRY
jgi:hypothetical protein